MPAAQGHVQGPGQGTGAYPTGPTGAYPTSSTGAYPAGAGTGAYPAGGGTGAYPASGATGAYGNGPRQAGGQTGRQPAGRQQAPGPSSGPQPAYGANSGPQPTYGASSGPQPIYRTGSGPQAAYRANSGAQPVLGPGSGPLRALDRDPTRGFPPRGAQQEHAADSWYSPTGGYAPADSYAPADGHGPQTGGYATQAGGYAPPAPAAYSPPPPGSYSLPPAESYAPPPAQSYASPPPAQSYDPPPAESYNPPTTESYDPSATAAFAAPAAESYTPPREQYDFGPDDDALADQAQDRRSGRRLLRRPVVIASAAVLVLAALGAAGYKLVYEPRSAINNAKNSLALPTTDPTAGNPYISSKLGQFQHIDTRKEDPVPLSINELYPPVFTLQGGGEFVRATADLTKTCGLAVIGDLIQAALQSGDCNQVVRADYVSGDGQIMGTIGVANLSSTYWAGQAAKTAGSSELIAPLTTDKGPTKNLLTGTGLAFAEVKGHYLILLYAEFTNTKTPKTAAQKQELVTFANDVFTGSADIALSHRFLGQKP
jgi:hypothetical protein